MERIVLAANADADQPWVAAAVAEIAQQTGARVAVLSVDELEAEALSTLPRSEFQARARAAADRAVERLAGEGVEASATVRPGRPLDQILAFADEQAADLVVVGSSTRSRLASRLLGNVPLQLVERSPRPVLVVTEPSAPTTP